MNRSLVIGLCLVALFQWGVARAQTGPDSAATGAAVATRSGAASSDSTVDSAADAPLSLEWGATYASWYSFQGLDYSDRRPVVQASLGCNFKSLSLELWGNLDQATELVNEADVTLEMSWSRGHLSGSVGAAHLEYPHRPGWDPSQEILASAELDASLKPSFSLHWDVDRGHGRYWAFGLEHEFAGPGLAIAAQLYAQEHYYAVTGLSAFETRVGVKHEWAGVSWEPTLARIWSWENGDFRREEAVTPGWLLSVSMAPRR